jgi:hypothetical protein
MMTCSHVKKYTATDPIGVADDGRVMQDQPGGNSAGEEFLRAVDARVRAYGISWGQAFEHVRFSQEGRELLRRYGRRSVPVTRNSSESSGADSASPDRPDIEVDSRARVHMDRSGEASYAKAVAYVLNADPELRRACAKFIGRQGSLGVNS